MRFVDCTLEAHGSAILEIFNEAILNSTALYEYKIFPPEKMTSWFADKRAGNYPVIGAVDDRGALLGFASYGVFRARPAYKYTIEHSVYVHKEYRGTGIGKALLPKLIEAAQGQNYHVMIGGIDAENKASIELHKKFGFVHAGTITQSGFKFGRWLDLVFYQLTLNTPNNPVDG
ncbi:MAG TPA: GNAT family N-acetyltransferase [Steroidobacteraceae bacterium]|nr:GNAT family N-acetyltransferase [Steroidobacteraceae bacterium]